nr:Enzyme that catalyzes the fourth step in the histidine pathway [Polyrhizophydium stewartii]
MTIFRPCIDLHEGAVKQIVGASLSDAAPSTLRTNFVSSHPPAYYAGLYRGNGLRGAHVIKLGPGNDAAAREALAAWPRGLQVIVTSWLFPDARLDMDRLRRLTESIGRQSLVVDLSCKRQGDAWIVAMNKWQTPTDLVLSEESMADLGEYAAEFLVHAADVEGLCQGVDEQLVQDLGDIALVDRLSNGRVDLTYGSALDIFGGSGVKFDDLVKWNQSRQ